MNDLQSVPPAEPAIGDAPKPSNVLISNEDGKLMCPKCKQTSGNDWSQCEGVCPLTTSPHYRAAVVPTPQADVPGDAEVETEARAIAARKMHLVKDPYGHRLPDHLWKQAVPQARAAILARLAPSPGQPVVPDELRKLSEAATPGVWEFEDEPYGSAKIVAPAYGVVAETWGDNHYGQQCNPEFIVAAVNFVRSLLDTPPSSAAKMETRNDT